MGTKRKYRVIDSFCGAGGLSLGLQKAGFEIKLAFDNNEWAVKSYNNFFEGNHCKQLDITKISGNQLLRELGLEEGELDLFAGGPPCQGFSRQKKGAENGDERNNLVLDYARLVTQLSPKVFLLENVDMLGLKRGEEFLKKIKRRLSNYNLYPNFYNSADYGVPQTRVRFITIGVRKDIEIPFEIPKPISREKWKTIGDVLSGLPEPPVDYSPHPSIFNHQLAKISEINTIRFSHVPQGGGWKDIPFDLRLECHKIIDTSKGGWPDVYGRLDWNGQCPTITGGFDSFTRGRFGHPKENRAITAREAALIQGFPLNFEFIGNRGEVRKQIGNAVPPPLAKEIGLAIKKILDNTNQSKLEKSLVSSIKSEKVLT
ncbi:MAG: DNA cytosine methyltransferase [Sporocytophaga sp.]|uniref:DNA cytosine methyltransferase n=1 Tax=Sporocytophaga sp. TaxID=2231183 RepID=UPI001B27833B|nr:DNA cytosine methyltransferase [Sporocytophaga sp.]MBO9703674.1 DNA cytosine methyltransferase [Sporocytophaga sp.]